MSIMPISNDTTGLGNSVFLDLNANGVQDQGEFGAANVLVKLLHPDGSAALDGDGNPITTTTDGNGAYQFTGLAPGEYRVMFVAPEGFTFTTANAGGDDASDSDANPFNNGITHTVLIEDGDFNDTLDAGLVRPAGIGNFVFNDTNANGVQDEGEQGIAGVEIALLADTDNDGQIDDVVKTTTTEADGSYEFTGLTQGDYRVRFTQPDGFDTVSPFQAGFDNSLDSDAGPELTSDVISLNPGDFNTKIDAGFLQKTPGLGDFVFLDSNANGIQDQGEFGAANVLVKLLNSDGSAALDGDGNAITTTTDNKGAYAFFDLTPGEYRVMFVAPEGFTFTTANAGGDDASDSDANPFNNGITHTVLIEDGDFNDTLDAGLVRPAGIGNFVFNDTNANGVQNDGEQGIAGVEVKLLADTDNDGQIDDVVKTTTTDADGSYEFTGLTQGDYRVMFTQPDGFDSVSPFRAGFDDSLNSDANPDNSLISDVVSLNPGTFNNQIDAGFFQKTPGLGNFVFIDGNANGVQDEGEFGATGVVVNLLNPDGSAALDNDGTPITTTTDNQGAYAFFNLTPGEYKVQFVAPEGFVFTTANAGSNDALDSDANPFSDGMTHTVLIADGDFNDTLDAGLVRPAGIGNFVFNDTNANGVQDDDEQGIAGVEVALLADTDNDGQIDNVVKTTTTGTDGSYEFTGLTQGDYRVRFTQPDGFNTVSPFQAGFDNSLDSDAGPELTSDVISLNPGDFNTKIDAGFYNTAESKDIQFKFDGKSYTTGYYGNVRTFNSEGVSVDVSAFRSNKAGTHFDQAYLGSYGGGLGVTNRSEWGAHHRVDNGTSLDYVLFEFDQDVVLDRAFLNYVGYDSDISVWIGDRNGADISHLDGSLLNSFTQENNFTHSSYSRWADVNASELAGDTVIISAYTNGSNDSFKLQQLDITVPDWNPESSTPTEYVYEAEDLNLYGYQVENLGSSIASGGKGIKLFKNRGAAAVNFTGATGEYDIVIGYYDENDGQAKASLKVGGEKVDTWRFNQHTNSHLATADNFVEHTIDNVYLEAGEELKVLGQRNYNEFARIDYIKVIASDTTNVYADTSAFQ